MFLFWWHWKHAFPASYDSVPHSATQLVEYTWIMWVWVDTHTFHEQFTKLFCAQTCWWPHIINGTDFGCICLLITSDSRDLHFKILFLNSSVCTATFKIEFRLEVCFKWCTSFPAGSSGATILVNVLQAQSNIIPAEFHLYLARVSLKSLRVCFVQEHKASIKYLKDYRLRQSASILTCSPKPSSWSCTLFETCRAVDIHVHIHVYIYIYVHHWSPWHSSTFMTYVTDILSCLKNWESFWYNTHQIVLLFWLGDGVWLPIARYWTLSSFQKYVQGVKSQGTSNQVWVSLGPRVWTSETPHLVQPSIRQISAAVLQAEFWMTRFCLKIPSGNVLISFFNPGWAPARCFNPG